MGSMWPWTYMHMCELLPLAWIASLPEISQNVWLCVLGVSCRQWPRKWSSASASSFAINLDIHVQKPTIRFRRLLGMRQWAIHKLRSGFWHFMEVWSAVESDECSGRLFMRWNQLMIDRVHSVMLDNWRITITELFDKLGLSFGLVQSILMDVWVWNASQWNLSQNCWQSSRKRHSL